MRHDRLGQADIFTIGYQLRSLADFVQELQRAGVDVVLDVREVAWSNRREYSQGSLRAALGAIGIEYIHARFAGNPKELRRAASSHEECLKMYDEYLDASPSIVAEFDSTLTQLIQDGRKACLLCYERHPGDCHRTILLRHWKESTGAEAEVLHLSTEGAPRLIGGQIG